MITRLYPAEAVLPGHPDKLCDTIADRLVAEGVRREPRALCGVEVAVHRSTVLVTGRIACRGARSIDVRGIVRDVYAAAGYGTEWPPDPAELKIRTDLWLGPLNEGEAQFREVSDDQSIVTGYAVDIPGTDYLPPEHWLVHRIAGRLPGLRTERPDLQLGPDGKLALVLEELDEERYRVQAFSASLQQKTDGPEVETHRAVRELLASELRAAGQALPGLDPSVPDDFHVNGAGNFEVGGPEGDNGLSGKKLVADAYGPRVPIGGGALFGKDSFKADRALPILARRVAKLVVMTGVARECTATLCIFPGERTARITSLRTGDNRFLDPARWSALFDLSLANASVSHPGPGAG